MKSCSVYPDTEMSASVRGPKGTHGASGADLYSSLLSSDEVNLPAYTSVLHIKISLTSFFDAKKTALHLFYPWNIFSDTRSNEWNKTAKEEGNAIFKFVLIRGECLLQSLPTHTTLSTEQILAVEPHSVWTVSDGSTQT